MTIASARVDVEPLSTASTVVALPPSDLDPATDHMRVYVNGLLTLRDYDPVMEQP